MTTQPSDAALAAAFREMQAATRNHYPHSGKRQAVDDIERRARELDTYQSATDSAGIGRSELDAAKGGLTEAQKVERDAYLYGTGFMRDGKHIPAQEVMVSCRHDWATDGMGDYCRHCKKREDSYTPPTQPGDAVDRVRCALWENRTGTYDAMARAAIAAMPAGE